MSVSYAIPGIIGKIMDNLFLGRVVESTLQADLNRFKDYAQQSFANVVETGLDAEATHTPSSSH
jgi:uncharacterized membrane protein